MNLGMDKRLPEAIIPWYQANCRDLPWRRDRDPYHIWLSEIMLQQTRVEAVKGYYSRFLEELPTIAELANADDELLHKLWEGLGYYNRVRNLKKAACQIMEVHGGVFPQSYEAVLSLPGIGMYTAGAICSIAFDQRTPAVDGNVLRVISRLTNDATPIDLPAYKSTVQTRLQEIYPAQAGVFTQALMELGATVCGPNKKPDCLHCPCRTFCAGFLEGTANALPVKNPKRQRRIEEKTVLILCCDGKYALQKRNDQGLLRGLWQFPNFDGRLDVKQVLEKVEELGLKPYELIRQVERKHIFTHVQWNMCGVYMNVKAPNADFSWFTPEEIQKSVALPTAFRLFWVEIENCQ